MARRAPIRAAFRHACARGRARHASHRARLRERGFNQSLEIAKPIIERWTFALLPQPYERISDTRKPNDIAVERTAKNVRGAFACREDFAGKHIAIIDDVMTSGASVNEFAKTLKKIRRA